MSKMSSGGRNLMRLGLIATLITILTTTISLAIYHNSGDIYLDRSRPGFLPEKHEVKSDDQPEKTYSFPESGNLDSKTLEEFRENFEKTLEDTKNLKDPFSADNLSDDFVGLKSPNK